MAGDFSFIDGLVPTDASFNALIRDQLIFICTSTTRPVSPTTYTRIYETDTGYEYWWNGSSWVLYFSAASAAGWTTYTPTWTGSTTHPVLGNGTLTGTYRLVGKTLDLRIYLLIGSTTTLGSGSVWYFSLPLSLSVASPYAQGSGEVVTSSAWPVTLFATATTVIGYVPIASNDVRCTYLSPSYPSGWATNGYFFAALTAEVS